MTVFGCRLTVIYPLILKVLAGIECLNLVRPRKLHVSKVFT